MSGDWQGRIAASPELAIELVTNYEEPPGVRGPFQPGEVRPPLLSRMSVEQRVPILIGDGQFYGYLSEGLQPREQYPAPIADPLTWIPHAVNASAISSRADVPLALSSAPL